MKRFFALFLILLMVLPLFACAGGGETDGTTAAGTTTATDTTTSQKPDEYDDSYTKEVSENLSSKTDREGRPTDFEAGKGFEDLIFYENEGPTNEEKLADLPKPTVIIDQEYINDKSTRVPTQYGNMQVVTVDDDSLPFDSAVRTTVHTVPEYSYHYQIACGTVMASKNVPDRAAVLVSGYIRLVEGERGEIGFVIEQDGSAGTYDKLLSVTAEATSEWRKFYFPVTYKNGYTSVSIRLGYCEQVIELGGFSIAHYGTAVVYDELPIGYGSSSLDKDAKWREEAFDRIEEVRKGDIKVNVKDSDGNVIEGAKVELEMFEHEFEWGMGVGTWAFTDADIAKLGAYFNAAVLENQLKWCLYEDDPALPKNMMDKLRGVGIDTFRGHCLLWDRVRGNNDSSVPEELVALYGDKEAMMKLIKDHIEEIMTDMKDYIQEWDVLNEACTNTVMQDKYGRELISEWFKMARESGVDVDLYYNDFVMTDKMFELLDLMEEMEVDYDGIGIQSHFSNPYNMETLYKYYQKMASYGKRLKVTEYDFACADEKLQAEYTRDMLILAFSVEEMDGFYMWGLRGGQGNRYVLFNEDGSPRLSLEQYTDLVYNKWWTEEEGRTDESGSASFRGFYGSYYISVIAGGVKKTVAVDCFKGENNEITIVMPE